MNLFNRVVSVGELSMRIMSSEDFELFFGEAPSLQTVLKVGRYASKQKKILVPKEVPATEDLGNYWFHLDLFEVAERLYLLRNTVMYDSENDVFVLDI